MNSGSRLHSLQGLIPIVIHATLVLSLLCLVLTSRATAQTWTQTWSDEFNGTANSPINALNWTYDTGILNVNNEVEYYCEPSSNTAPCSSSTPNASIDGNGHLIIQAILIPPNNPTPYSGSWTSARLKTQGLQSFQYGRLESSMALPIGPGLWPAYWALGTNISSVGWPSCGEIDYMENVPPLGKSVISSTLHGGASSSNCYCGGNGLSKQYTFPSNDPNGADVTTFHAYGAIWSPYMVQFYVDNPTSIFFVRTANDVPSGLQWEFNHPFFVLLNLAVGGTGSWPGPPSSSTPNPAVMSVDYVRWYTASAIAGPTMSGPAMTVTAGQTGQSALSLTSTAGTGRVYLSCTTNAPKATCTISSSDPLNQYTVDFSQSATGSATVTVTTTANTSARSPDASPTRRWSVLAGSLALAGIVLVPVGRARRLRYGLSGLGLILVLVLSPHCGGGGSSGGSGGGGGGGGNGTAPGSYTVTVNAYTVSNTGAAPDSTASIALNVN